MTNFLLSTSKFAGKEEAVTLFKVTSLEGSRSWKNVHWDERKKRKLAENESDQSFVTHKILFYILPEHI